MKHIQRGLAKRGPPVKQATALRLDHLEEVLAFLSTESSTYDCKLYRAAFALAYYASLRVGEYATTSGQNHALQ